MTHPYREAMSVVPDPDDAATAFGELENLLWRERGMLERMLYRLVAQSAVVSAGEWRWLQASDEDVRDAIAPLQACEVARAAVSEELAGRYGLSSDVSLQALAAVAPDPWSVILDDHRTAIRELEKDIREVAARTSQSVREAFDVDDGEYGLRSAPATDRDGMS